MSAGLGAAASAVTALKAAEPPSVSNQDTGSIKTLELPAINLHDALDFFDKPTKELEDGLKTITAIWAKEVSLTDLWKGLAEDLPQENWARYDSLQPKKQSEIDSYYSALSIPLLPRDNLEYYKALRDDQVAYSILQKLVSEIHSKTEKLSKADHMSYTKVLMNLKRVRQGQVADRGTVSLSLVSPLKATRAEKVQGLTETLKKYASQIAEKMVSLVS